MLNLTYLSYIDFVTYVYFKPKHNLYVNEHSFNTWLIVLQLYLGYHTNFFPINKYQLLLHFSIHDLEDSFSDKSL